MIEGHSDSLVDFTIRVRYAETDQMGVAYYANYLAWFEVGRTEFCRARGFTYSDMEKESETFLPVAEVQCRYLRPLTYDSEFLIRTRVKEFRKRVLIFSYQIFSLDLKTLHAEGETVHVFTDSRGRPKSLPKQYWKYLAD